MTRYYKVADHTFCVSGDADVFAQMEKYELFSCDAGEPIFILTVSEGEAVDYLEDARYKIEERLVVSGHTANNEAVYEYQWKDETGGWLVCSKDYHEGRLVLTGRNNKRAVNYALNKMFALSTANKDTAIIHAVAVIYQGLSYLFLGPCGTGKSTHADLWVKYIEGAELLNGDNPVVRIINGRAIAYGSPWSNKQPCYRNECAPIGGLVLLSQAPYNKIRRLNQFEAYMMLMRSINNRRRDKSNADGLHETENSIASTLPMWYLECLPNKEAAILCQTTITMTSV